MKFFRVFECRLVSLRSFKGRQLYCRYLQNSAACTKTTWVDEKHCSKRKKKICFWFFFFFYGWSFHKLWPKYGNQISCISKPRALYLDTTTFPSRCTQTLRSLSDTQWHLHFTTFGAIKKTHSSLFKEISWESCRWVVFSQGEGDDSQRGEGVCSSGSLCLFLSRKQIFILPVVRTSHSSSPSSLSLGKFVSGHIFAFSYIFSLIVHICFFLRSQPGVHFRLKKRTGHSESELGHHRVAQTSSSDTAESESVTDDPDVKVQFGERRVYLLSMLMMLSVGGGGGSYMWGYPWRFICPGIFLQFGVYCKHTHTHTRTMPPNQICPDRAGHLWQCCVF